MTSLLFTGALVIPCDGRRPFVEDGWVHVEGDRIDGVGSGTAPADIRASAAHVVDLNGAILAPGFVSSHGHLFTSGSRGLGADQTLYGWCSRMYASVADASPEDIYWCSLHGALDYLGAGVTTAFDFADTLVAWSPLVDGRRTDLRPLRPTAYSTRQADAKADAGIRFVHAINLDDAVGTEQDVFDRFDAILSHVRGLNRALALDGAVMGSVQWSDTPATAVREAEVMRRHGVRNQAHFLETEEQLDVQRSKFSWYDRSGALGPDFVFGHFVHPTPGMVDRVATTDTAVSWQPTANGRLGSGIAPVVRLRRAGVRVGLGLDDQACTDVADPWQNMRMGLYVQRAAGRAAGLMSTEDVLDFATRGAADLLGVADRVGSIEPGKYADLLVVDPASPDLGPIWSPLDHYVLACGTRNLRSVYLGGRLVADRGRILHPLAQEAGVQIRRRLAGFGSRPSVGRT
jgi:cytosine/adenosine deaminase-related metal-dependent hydrolase